MRYQRLCQRGSSVLCAVVNRYAAHCVRSGIIDRSCQSGILIFVHLEKHAVQWDTVAKIVYNRYIKMQDMEVCT